MKKLLILVLAAWTTGFQGSAQDFQGPLRVHPDNGRYFTDNTGKAILLTGSHTWANFQEIGLPGDPAFDWTGYLDMLSGYNHNFIRMWTWEQSRKAAWTQDEISFSPLPYPKVLGKGKELYDLEQWNEVYFQRLKERVMDAGKRGIYVSVMLFQGWSQNKTETPGADPWEFHPYNPHNNLQGIGKEVKNHYLDDEALGTLHSMNNGDVLRYQEAYVRKVIETINDLDNVLYEILNEGGTRDWQYHMIRLIKKIEKNMPKQHPVGMTHAVSVNPPMENDELWNSPADWISPAMEPIDWLYPGSSLLQDYQDDPPANPGTKVVITDTDHLWGHGGNNYWVWKSFLRGLHPIFMDPWQRLAGSLDKEKMTWMFIKGGISKDERHYPDWEPVRLNMGYIRKFALRMDLAQMIPAKDLSTTGYCLANPGVEYLVYFPEGGTATLDLRDFDVSYEVEWFIPQLDRTLKGSELLYGNDYVVLTAPFSSGDAVLYLKNNESEPLNSK